MIAITRPVSDSLQNCELTHQQRVTIDVVRARREHDQYEAALRALGCDVVRLAPLHDHPDAVFVEDTAVVVAEQAIIARPGAESRRSETASMRGALEPLRPLAEIEQPGTLDGGDVLRVGKRIFVGISTRTNEQGAAQLAQILAPFGYTVTSVQVTNCLHLKSAASALTSDLMIVNAHAVDPQLFGVPYLCVPDGEPQAANVLAVNGRVLCPADAPLTLKLLQHHRFDVVPVMNAELAKAEGGLTCCSVLVER